MSPYKGKLDENTCTLFFLKIGSYLNAGAPIGMPSALASLLLEITQPSLFDKITIGFLSNFGLKTLSQEA
jgi:hypothetical protein